MLLPRSGFARLKSEQAKSALIKRHFSFLKCLFFVFYLINPISSHADSPCLSPQQQLSKVKEWPIVSKVVDGDTIHLKDGRKVRFIGINTPEIGYKGKRSQPFAQKAKKVLQQLLKENSKLGLYYDLEKKDRYKRILAFAILQNGKDIAQILLQQGLAHSIVIPPNIQQLDCYRQLEKNARELQSGIWQLADKQLKTAQGLAPKTKGYRFVSGQIKKYSESKKSIYLKSTEQLSIRIAKKDILYFSSIHLKSLAGRKVLVRGWVNTYKGRQSIHIRSEHDLQIIHETSL